MAAIELFRLEGKVALISGGSRGIGEAMAHGLAEQGAHVIVSSRKLEACEVVAQAIRDEGGEASAMACHAGDLEAIEALFADIKSRFGGIDILINNGGTNPYFGPVAETPPDAFQKTFDVNLRGPFFMSEQAVAVMKERGGGAIVNVASIDGISAGTFQGVYSATKAAMISMTQSFALENGQYGIRVNALCPGLTETKFTAVFTEQPEAYQQTIKRLPLQKSASPIDMVGATLLMVSAAGACMTGQTLVIDNGALIAHGL
jgi:NAD(P)-dependent dehydrogenase (short-subunit alcohol dehydrogenase family)